MLQSRARSYLLTALDATPDVLDRLLSGVTDTGVYDRRLAPDQFTLREILAHLADWTQIYRDRLVQTRDTNNGQLSAYDEGQLAIDRNYAQSDPQASLQRFRAGRQELLSVLKELSDEQWNRSAVHPEYGNVTVDDQLALIAGHDGYHLQEIARVLGDGSK